MPTASTIWQKASRVFRLAFVLSGNAARGGPS